MLSTTSCGSGSGAPDALVTIEPLSTVSAAPNRTAPIGGKPAAPPSEQQTMAATEAEVTQAPAQEQATADVPPTATPTPQTLDGSVAPTEGRWIDVDVANYIVRLMDGGALVEEIRPVGVGVQVDTGEYLSTQTGLFAVQSKIEELAYDPPYDTYISHWVGFDTDRANGFHSFLKDESGNVVDPSTGRVSNGCIRTGAAEAIYAYAEIGTPVWVHW
jgi:hypothetical protein